MLPPPVPRSLYIYRTLACDVIDVPLLFPFREADSSLPSCRSNALQLEYRGGDLTGGRNGDRGRGLLEHEQPRTGDLARKRLAVADGNERVLVTMHHEHRDRELG
jgi:hypothetical protein